MGRPGWRNKGTLLQSRAEAEGNRELARSLTGQIVDYERAKRWDGKLPQVSAGQAGVMFQVPALK